MCDADNGTSNDNGMVSKQLSDPDVDVDVQAPVRTANTGASASASASTSTSTSKYRRGKREKEGDFVSRPKSPPKQKLKMKKKSRALQKHGKNAASGGIESLLPSFIGVGVLALAIMAHMGFRGRASVAGIDLGTTNSVICVQAQSKSVGEIDCIKDPDTGSPIIPSVVSFLESHERKVGPSSKIKSSLVPHPSYVVVGHKAKQRIDSHPHHTLYNAKRILGRLSSDPAVKDLQHEVEFSIQNQNKENGEALFNVDDVLISPEQVGSYVVHHLMQITQAFLGHGNVKSAVLAVPAKFDQLQRQRTMEAFKNAGVKITRVLEEPAAAALAYGLHKKAGVEKILVYDFGGGTLDVSVLHVADEYCEVIGSDGDDRLGGADFDASVANLLVKQHPQVFNNLASCVVNAEDLSASCSRITEDLPLCSKTCACGSNSKAARRRRMSWTGARYGSRTMSFGYSSPLKTSMNGGGGKKLKPQTSTSGNSNNETVCRECGRVKNADYEGMDGRMKSPRQIRLSSWLDTTRTERLEAPKHAEALLQSTPQLRIISPTSTDMQGFGGASSNNLLSLILPSSSQTQSKKVSSSDNGSSRLTASDYRASLVRDRANQQAATELASLLWILAHEMSLEDYGAVESEVFTSVFALVHAPETERRMAGLAALDALIDAPSADEEKKAIKFANTLSNGLRSAHGDYEFLSAVSKALGHMATRTANVDFVESEITRALEWLRTDRSDRRLAACLSLKEFATYAPSTFYSETNQSTLGQGGSNDFLDSIFQAVRDPQPIVRASAADALSRGLKIWMDRQHPSLTGLLCQVHFSVMEGLEHDTTKKSWNAISKAEATQHGSLLVVSTMLSQTLDFMLPRYDEVCIKVMEFMEHPKALMRLEVIRLLPRLARRCQRGFSRRYLEKSLNFLLESATNPTPPRVRIDLRPSAFSSIGLLVLAMADTTTGDVIGGASLPTVKITDDPDRPGERHIVELSETGVIYQKLDQIFELVSWGLKHRSQSTGKATSDMHISAFHCAADLVEALGDMALPYITTLIDDMFRAGLSNDLIQCLHAIAECVPAQQSIIEDRLLQEVSICLAGIKSARDVCDPLLPLHSAVSTVARSTRAPTQVEDDLDLSGGQKRDANNRSASLTDIGTEVTRVRINTSSNPQAVSDLVLSLQTLGSFGDSMGRVTTFGAVVPLLPFIRNVAAQYLSHPSSEVRRAAALTCCVLLVPPGIVHKKRVGGHSGRIIEDVLDTLLRVAVSDPSPVVRLCVVRALDSRYDPFLCQAHHLQPLFLLLQDELLATRAAGVRLIGRLAALNPAPILPYMRKCLLDLIVELQCGVDTGRGREEATRLLVVFLRSTPMQRLVHPVLPALVGSLPLDGGTPRLASAALEALGELAKAAGASLQPWVKEVVPNILETLQDQSSASKQRTSLRTLAQIAGSTGYVVQPYIDYPKLLSQATDILPGTKRAPWALRREVIRTLGVLGALDPDRYHTVAPKTKVGNVGGAYFVVQEEVEITKEILTSTETPWAPAAQSPLNGKATIGYAAVGGSSTQTIGKMSTTFVPGKLSSSLLANKKTIEPFNETSSPTVDSDDDLPAHLSMYEQYAMVAQPVSSLPPARRMTPGDEEFYPTVAIQALMLIFKDPPLAVHHGMVMQAIMFIFKSLGLRCVPFLSKVVPHIMLTIRTCGPSNLRESLLKQVATLSGIVREHLRPYVADIFDVVEQFWPSRHLGTIFSLVLHIAVGVPDEFRRFVPRLIRRIITSLDEMQVADWATTELRPINRGGGLRETERLRLILCSIRSLRGVLGDYLHVLVPALLKLADSLAPLISTDLGSNGDWAMDSDLTNLTVLALQTTAALLECEGTGGVRTIAPYWGDKSGACIRSGSLSARVVQPLIRLLGEKCTSNRAVGMTIIETLCVCAKQLGCTTWMKLYYHAARVAIADWQDQQLGVDDDVYNQGGVESYSRGAETQPSGLRLYDDVVHDLQASPLRRSYNNPFLNDGLRTAQRQDSMLLIGGDPLQQPMFNDNPSITAAFDATADAFDNPVSPPFQQSSSKQKINQAYLQRAWDVSQCASRDDWDEWMRRLAIQLLREAPSPALRAAASLAHAYQPLSRELFSAAFVCCWKELSEPYRVNLVHALETAFVADVSPEILQTLLNLAEFMEHDPSGGLPIDIPILADLALKCRAYAKALHYQEREHNMGGTNSCVEALISINRKLDLPEAALGVLKSATLSLEVGRFSGGPHITPDFVGQHQTHAMFYSVFWSTESRAADNTGETLDLAENKELWLAKLGSWTEALQVYEKKLARNPRDFDAILGCMRCLSASGEWRRVLELTEDNWPTLSGSTALESQGATQAETNGTSQETVYIAPRDQKKALRMCAEAAWRLGRWDDLEKYSSELVHGQGTPPSAVATVTPTGVTVPRVDFDGAFFSAVLHVHRKEWTMAAEAIDAARKAMDSRFTALMAESYNRAYPSMVTAQILAELEEIIEYRKIETGSQASAHRHPANRIDADEARVRLLSVWRDRLAGCRVDADVHSSILAVRSLVLGPTDEVDSTLTLSELSRQAQRFKLAERALLDPLEKLGADLDGPIFGFGLSESLGLTVELDDALVRTPVFMIIDGLVTSESRAFLPSYSQIHDQWSKRLIHETGGLDRLKIQHRLYFAFLKHLWLTDRRGEAMHRLTRLCDVVDLVSHCESVENTPLRAACWLELGEWKMEEMTSRGKDIPEPLQIEVLCEFKRAIMMDGCGYKAWHAWALLNFRLAQQMNERDDNPANPGARRRGPASNAQRNHVVTAIKGFVNAIKLGTKRWSASVQQDMLNLLTCLFKYGDQPAIAAIVNECVESVAIETWLGVLPQLLARIHIKNPSIRSVLHPLLVRLGEKHPQALMYPLSVLLKSPVIERKSAAESLMNSLRSHSSALVEEALMVSSELIRVAILWLETWHEGLEEASRLYFGESNVSGMLDLLLPLHEKLEKGAETRRESEFIQSFGQDLAQAHLHIKDYIRLVTDAGSSIPTGPSPSNAYDPSGRLLRQNEEAETAMNKAWDIYYTVFRRINKQLPALTKLELNQCSPALCRASSLELGVPGSYRVDGSYVKIEKFIPSVQVITSKQRPRKITLRGSDGKDYVFLLKGHEDLRQDERVMQLFGLVNALLERDRQTKKHDLRIQRYAISPLSHNCGLVGWVPHTDTLHSLIRDYRQSKKTPLNLEHREMLKIAPDYDLLTVMQKVEVFTEALRRTTGKGNDLYEILWLKSTNSEEWLERRTKFTRSLAVMSMVGYILGLGDRHPSNLMLDKLSGRILHIDFGDCFEVAMMRDKYPEKVPFRLTRMLIKAMEISGIEGSYRSTCERTMTVLRESRDSLVVMLEAFVYDPLISWRLVDLSTTENQENLALGVEALRARNPILETNENGIGAVSGVPIDMNGRSSVLNAPITEGPDEDGDEDGGDVLLPEDVHALPSLPARKAPKEAATSATKARSLQMQMYSNIQTMAANLGTDSRIASITGNERGEQVAASGSIARSRIERSVRQRGVMSLIEREDGHAHEEQALNEKALKVIRRVQDKLAGTDFPDRDENAEPLDVVDQVQRLIVQATSVENLCQLFIGWCAFW